jgi:hypothetical protein
MMRMRNTTTELVVSLVVVLGGCSATKGHANLPSNSAWGPSTGTIVGKAQLASGSGAVQSLTLQPVKLVQQAYSVLTDSQKQDIGHGDDYQDNDALRLGVMSLAEFNEKAEANADAWQSFQKRLPEKQAIQAISSGITDARGNFRLENIKPGTYWIFLDTEFSGNHVGWAVKVDVAPAATVKVELNDTNLDYEFR